MTKVVALRITVAADDAVETKDVKQRLAALVVERGTEPVGENGTGGRVHWATVEVLQGPERVPGRRSRGRAAIAREQLDIPAMPT